MNANKGGDRLMTVKDIVNEYGFNHLTVQRILKSGVVPNTFIMSRRSGYRVRKADWDAYLAANFSVKPQDGQDNA